jgi:hypothetical protein
MPAFTAGHDGCAVHDCAGLQHFWHCIVPVVTDLLCVLRVQDMMLPVVRCTLKTGGGD